MIYLALFTVIGIYGLANYYIGLRIFQYIVSYIGILSVKAFWPVFGLIAASFFIGRFDIGPMPSVVRKMIDIIGSYWIAAMVYLLILFPLADLLRAVFKHMISADSPVFQSHHLKLFIGVAVLALVAGILIYGTYQAESIKIDSYDIKINKNAGRLKELHAACPKHKKTS